MKHVLLLLILMEYVSPERFIYVTNPIVSMDFQILCLFFPFWKKGSLLPFICLRPDVHHSLHINHQSVAPFSPPPPPALNLFTFLSFPFLYRESRLIRRSLGLIFIKGSREGELAAGWGGLVITIIFHIQSRDKEQMDISIPHLKGNRQKRFFAMIVKSQCAKSLNVRNNAKIVVIIIMGRRKKRDSEHLKHMENLNGGKKKHFYRRQSIEQVVKLETRAEKRGQCGFPCRTDWVCIWFSCMLVLWKAFFPLQLGAKVLAHSSVGPEQSVKDKYNKLKYNLMIFF